MKTSRVIKRVFVHCTGTRLEATVDAIMNGFKARGWQNPGYHFLIDQWGMIHTLLGIDHVANGVKGYNSTSIHVAYIGGIDADGKIADTRTDAQRHSLRAAIKALQMDFPRAEILGHRDISADTNGNGRIDPWERIKECPCFDVRSEL